MSETTPVELRAAGHLEAERQSRLRALTGTLALRASAAALILLGVVPLGNLMTDGRIARWWRPAVGVWLTKGVLLALLALALAWLLRGLWDSLLDRGERLLCARSRRAFGLGIAVLVTALATAFTWYCFPGSAFTGDEVAQRWQARMLLAGRLFLPTEPHPEFFSTPVMLDAGGRWFSQFPVGGPAVLAVGMLVGAVRLVNPILAGFTAWNLYRFASCVFDETIGRGAALLFAASPFVLIMSASEMNHVATLAALSLAIAELPAWADTADTRVLVRSAAIIGLAVGVAATIRPMDAALVAAVVGAFQLAQSWRDNARLRSLGWQFAAGGIPVALLLWANARTTGHPLLFGYDALNGPAHRPGFHVDPYGEPFTPYRALATTSAQVMRLNRFLYEWPIPVVLLIAGGLLAARRASRWDYFLLGLLWAVTCGYGLYWFDGLFAGPRFLYSALPALMIFTAQAPGRLSRALARNGKPTAARATLLMIPLCLAYAWGVAADRNSVLSRAGYYRRQHALLVPRFGAELRAAKLRDALVLIPDSWRARLVARLRVLGMRPLAAEALLDSTDACALQTALDVADTASSPPDQRVRHVLTAAAAAGRAGQVPGLPRDRQIALVPGSRPTPGCVKEWEADLGGTLPFDRFLDLETIGAGGRLAGPVVFARDMGPRDSLLERQFGDRRWYRYDPRRAVFVRVRGGT